MKAAVGCQLATLLTHTLGMEAAATEDHVDVLTDGFAFRLVLATERDAAMQQKALALSECMPLGGCLRVSGLGLQAAVSWCASS